MTHQEKQAGSKIKDMDDGQTGKIAATLTNDPNLAPVADSAAPESLPPRPALPAKVTERRWRRKNNINTTHGLIREHSRLIAAMHNGRMSLDKGEVLSRAYSRHKDMLSVFEQQEQLNALREQLEAITGKGSTLRTINPDDSEESN